MSCSRASSWILAFEVSSIIFLPILIFLIKNFSSDTLQYSKMIEKKFIWSWDQCGTIFVV